MLLQARNNLQSSINFDRSQGCTWLDQTIEEGNELEIVWFLVIFHIRHGLKKLFEWRWAEEAQQLWGSSHLFFANKKTLVVSLHYQMKEESADCRLNQTITRNQQYEPRISKKTLPDSLARATFL